MAFLEEALMSASDADVKRLRIVHALIELTKTTKYESITVGEICSYSGISRPTFYRLFGSKHEVASWFWCRLANEYTLMVGFKYTWYEAFYLNFALSEPYFGFFTVAAEEGRLDSLYHHATQLRKERIETAIQDVLDIRMTNQLQFELNYFLKLESIAMFGAFEQYGFTTPKQKALAITACIPENLRTEIDAAVLRLRAEGKLETPTDEVEY